MSFIDVIVVRCLVEELVQQRREALEVESSFSKIPLQVAPISE